MEEVDIGIDPVIAEKPRQTKHGLLPALSLFGLPVRVGVSPQDDSGRPAASVWALCRRLRLITTGFRLAHVRPTRYLHSRDRVQLTSRSAQRLPARLRGITPRLRFARRASAHAGRSMCSLWTTRDRAPCQPGHAHSYRQLRACDHRRRWRSGVVESISAAALTDPCCIT